MFDWLYLHLVNVGGHQIQVTKLGFVFCLFERIINKDI